MKHVLIICFIFLMQEFAKSQFFIGTWKGVQHIEYKDRSFCFKGDVSFITTFEKDGDYSILPRNKSLRKKVNFFKNAIFKKYTIVKNKANSVVLQLNFQVLTQKAKRLCVLKEVSNNVMYISILDDDGKRVNIKLLRI